MEITEDKLEKFKETHYEMGRRASLMSQLGRILKELGYGEDITKEALIYEREETIATLRLACDEFGDNDWEGDLHMTDIINKHLIRHIEE